MDGLLCLPEEVLENIAANSVTGPSKYEESWGAAAASCKRLHNLKIPGEYAEAKGLQSESLVLKKLPGYCENPDRVIDNRLCMPLFYPQTFTTDG